MRVLYALLFVHHHPCDVQVRDGEVTVEVLPHLEGWVNDVFEMSVGFDGSYLGLTYKTKKIDNETFFSKIVFFFLA